MALEKKTFQMQWAGRERVVILDLGHRGANAQGEGADDEPAPGEGDGAAIG